MKRVKRISGSDAGSPNKKAKAEPEVNGNGSEWTEKIEDADQTEEDSPDHVSESDALSPLEKHIRLENEFVKRVINCIPPHIYFNSETLSEVRENRHSAMDEKLEEVGLRTKRWDVSKKTKQKRVKLDPEQYKSVSEIIEEMGEKPVEKIKKKKGSNAFLPNAGDPAGIDELKSRLSAKLAALQGKPQAVEKREKQRLKRRMSKLKLKEKRKSEKASSIPIISTEKKAVGPMPAAKPVFNKEGKMVFSKFDFTDNGVEEKKKGEYSGKNYKHLLQKVEKEQEKLKALEEKDSEKASELKQKKKWKSVLDKADGVKVKDDPELLKKALLRKEKRKKKSAKAWAAREEAVKEKQEKRQKKREANIQARKKDKIKHKIKRQVKKGRMIPGF